VEITPGVDRLVECAVDKRTHVGDGQSAHSRSVARLGVGTPPRLRSA
jgi:hypothetical protein